MTRHGAILDFFCSRRFVMTGGYEMLRVMNRPAPGDEAHHHTH
jgi:hypothetical protein